MKNLTYLTLAIFCIFTFSACEEAEQGGCTDPYAENYESWADYDDSSCLYQCDDPYAINYNVVMSYPVCEYEGDVVFYLTVDGATYITNENVPFLDVYIGNYRAGTMPGNVGFTDVVLCNDTDPEPVHFLYQWEDEISTNMTWTVRDGDGYIWYEGTDLVLANNCLSLGLDDNMIKSYQDSH